MNKNPELKVGDVIILTKGMNSDNRRYSGKECIVITSLNVNYYKVKLKENQNVVFTIYESGPADEWVFSNRTQRAKSVYNTIKNLRQEIKDLEKEHTRLVKFKDDEEEVAHKLAKILEAKGDINAMADVLRELKQTNFL